MRRERRSFVRSRLELRLREQAGPILQGLRPALVAAAYVWRRMMFRTTFIGITGSLGKTTTKEALANVLSSQARTFRSFRSQNNTIAVALNILRVRPWHRYAVIEAAGAAPGMLKNTARILAPDVAVIINVLRTHTDAFPELEMHAAEKFELLRGLRAGGLAVLNADDPLVALMKPPDKARVKWFGTSDSADYRLSDARSTWPGRLQFKLSFADTTHFVSTQLVGVQWLGAAAAAATTSICLGIDPQVVADQISRTEPFSARLQPVQLPSGAIILRDDYNGSIDAIEPSLKVLAESGARRRVLVITDVSDFGTHRRHRLKYLGQRAAEVADAVVFVGQSAGYGARRATAAGMRPTEAHGFASLRQAAEFLRGDLRDGDFVLLKGRTTDHATRILFAQLGEISCWLDYCPKRMLCDTCWELGASPETLRRAVPASRAREPLPLRAEEIQQ
jgi:UDP-N-acetylmuramoyl-tripeptide--D-alanyl-D-alanine ligase